MHIIIDDSRDELIKMMPDESKTITLTLLNKGQSSNFTLTHSTETSDTIEVLESSLANTGPVFLEEDSSAEIEIHIKTFSNATGGGGTTVTLTVFVESSINSDIRDFITLPVMITEPPAPASTEFIINVRDYCYRVLLNNRLVSFYSWLPKSGHSRWWN